MQYIGGDIGELGSDTLGWLGELSIKRAQAIPRSLNALSDHGLESHFVRRVVSETLILKREA